MEVVAAPIIFLPTEGLAINIWLLRREKEIAIRQGRVRGDRTEKHRIRVLLETAFKRIGAEVYERREDRAFRVDNPLASFYDAVIGPIVDLLGPEDDDMVVVSNGELCLSPWAAVIEGIRLCTVPSLTNYQLVLGLPESQHKKPGALLVENPCLEESEGYRGDLPGAQKEVESIALILNTIPLVGEPATKAEVMKRMSSVGCPRIQVHWRNCPVSKAWLEFQVPS